MGIAERGEKSLLDNSQPVAKLKNSETDDFVGCIGTVRVLFMG